MRSRIHGLWVFAKTSGLFLGVQTITGVDVSDTGIAAIILNAFAGIFGDFDPFFTSIIIIGIPLLNLVTIIIHVKTAIDHKWRGVGASCGGFFGMFMLIIGGAGGNTVLAIVGILIMIATPILINYKFDD